MFPITRYYVKNENLVPWIKFIWHFEIDNAAIHNKLLPTDCIDLILNLSSDIFYKTESSEFIAQPFHINGLRDKYSYICQSGIIRIFGISFYSFGLYPFVHKSLEPIQNEIVDLHTISHSLAQKLAMAVSANENTNIILNIENALCSELQVSQNDINNTGLIRELLMSDESTTIHSFCYKHGLNIKTFERMVLRYTGYSPKTLRRIKRFQSASNQVIYQNTEQLINIAYDNGFTDQSHLIKDFQQFSGTTPRAFRQKKTTIKENVKYSYV